MSADESPSINVDERPARKKRKTGERGSKRRSLRDRNSITTPVANKLSPLELIGSLTFKIAKSKEGWKLRERGLFKTYISNSGETFKNLEAIGEFAIGNKDWIWKFAHDERAIDALQSLARDRDERAVAALQSFGIGDDEESSSSKAATTNADDHPQNGRPHGCIVAREETRDLSTMKKVGQSTDESITPTRKDDDDRIDWTPTGEDEELIGEDVECAERYARADEHLFPSKKSRIHICPHCKKSFSKNGLKYHLVKKVCQQIDSKKQVRNTCKGIVKKDKNGSAGKTPNDKSKTDPIVQPVKKRSSRIKSKKADVCTKSADTGTSPAKKEKKTKRGKKRNKNGSAGKTPDDKSKADPIVQPVKKRSSRIKSKKADVCTKSADTDSSPAKKEKKTERGKKRKRESFEQLPPSGRAKKFEELMPGSKLITKFGIVEVVADERLPINHHKSTIDLKEVRKFLKRHKRYCERKKVAVDQIAAGARHRREELQSMYIESKCTSNTGTSMTQQKIWDLYCKSITPKQILSEGLSWEYCNDVWKERNKKIEKFLEADPRYPEDYYADRIVECKLIADERAIWVGTDVNGKQDIRLVAGATKKAQHKTNPMCLFIARKELTIEYDRSKPKYMCGHCFKDFSLRILESHLANGICGPKVEADRERIHKQKIEEIERKALTDSNCHNALLTNWHAAKKPNDLKSADIPPSFGNPHKIKHHKKHLMPPWLVFNAQRSTMYPEIYASLEFRRGSQNRNHYSKIREEESHAVKDERSRLRKRERKKRIKEDNIHVEPTHGYDPAAKKTAPKKSKEESLVKESRSSPDPNILLSPPAPPPLPSINNMNTIDFAFGYDGGDGTPHSPPVVAYEEMNNDKGASKNNGETVRSSAPDGIELSNALNDAQVAIGKNKNTSGASSSHDSSRHEKVHGKNKETSGASVSHARSRHKKLPYAGESKDLEDAKEAISNIKKIAKESSNVNGRRKMLPDAVSVSRDTKQTNGSSRSSLPDGNNRHKNMPPNEKSNNLNGANGATGMTKKTSRASPSDGSSRRKKSQDDRCYVNPGKDCVVIDTQVLAMECEAGRYPSVTRFRGDHEVLCTLCKKPEDAHLINCDFCKNSFHQLCLDRRMLFKDPQVVIRENEPDDTPMCHECISTVLFRRWRAEARRSSKWQHELSKAGLGSVPEAARLTEEVDLKEGDGEELMGGVGEPTYTPCPNGGPGGLICCSYCTASYSRFLSNTAKEMEAQSVSRIGHEVSDILELLADAKLRLQRAAEVTQSNEERRGLLDRNQTAHTGSSLS